MGTDLTGTFVGLGILFAAVVFIAAGILCIHIWEGDFAETDEQIGDQVNQIRRGDLIGMLSGLGVMLVLVFYFAARTKILIGMSLLFITVILLGLGFWGISAWEDRQEAKKEA
jgi:hypothetical protein